MERRIGCAVLAFSLAACNGTSSGSIPSATTPNNVHTTVRSVLSKAEIEKRKHEKKVRVRFRLHVPNHKKFRNKRVRHRMTISENTNGLQVVAYASGDRSTPLGTVTADVSAATGGCTPGLNDARTCNNISLMAPPGPTDFVVTSYDVVPNGSGNFPGGNQIGEAVDSMTIVAGSTNMVPLTLDTVLSKLALSLTPVTIHTIIPASATLSVMGMDADFDVIVGDQYIDANGNPLTISLGQDNSLNSPFTGSSTLSMSTGSMSQSMPNGVGITYAGGYQGGGSTTVTFTASANGLTNATATLNAIDPTFASISDTNVQPNNPYHGGIGFDDNNGVFYTTPNNFGGVSYYNGTGTSVSNNYVATGSNPIRGTLTSFNGNVYGVAGNLPFTMDASEVRPTALPSPAAAIPNGSALAYDTTNNALWYTSGSNLAEYQPGNVSSIPIGVTADAGLTLDPSDNVWYVDNVNNQVCQSSGAVNCYSSLPFGSLPFDVLANANGIFVTDHGSTPEILQFPTGVPNGTAPQQITVPGGAIPWYLMADNAEPGIVWFDYLINGNQIGLARMDTNVSPPTFSMATDASGPGGSQPGAIGAASNGLVYMVFENTQTLVKVQR